MVLKTFPRKILELQAQLNVRTSFNVNVIIVINVIVVYHRLGRKSSKFTIKKLSDICTDINIPVPDPPFVNNKDGSHADGDLPVNNK